MDPEVARKTWRTLEPLHAMIYFVPEGDEEYTAVGLRGSRMGYFASRAAAFGAAPAEVVIATFYNFNPALVRRSIPEPWSLASPADILEARRRAAGRALRRGLGPELVDSPELVEVGALARVAAQAAVQRPQGRALFAAHASLEWPTDPVVALWHAQTLLREYRGDGHLAALVLADLDPVESLVTHEASGEIPPGFLQASRAWSDEQWQLGIDRLRSRGLLEPDGAPVLTDVGRELRQRVEDETDARSADAYDALGPDDCERLRTLGRPFSRAVVSAGLLTPDIAKLAET
jgi:hypothetical protein